MVELVRKIGADKCLRGKHSLKRNIVNGEDGLERQRNGMSPLGLAQQYRQQGGLPVMAVHDVRLKIAEPQHLHHRLAEKYESFGVVVVIAFPVSVRRPAIEKFLTTNEVDFQIGPRRKHSYVTR